MKLKLFAISFLALFVTLGTSIATAPPAHALLGINILGEHDSAVIYRGRINNITLQPGEVRTVHISPGSWIHHDDQIDQLYLNGKATGAVNGCGALFISLSNGDQSGSDEHNFALGLAINSSTSGGVADYNTSFFMPNETSTTNIAPAIVISNGCVNPGETITLNQFALDVIGSR